MTPIEPELLRRFGNYAASTSPSYSSSLSSRTAILPRSTLMTWTSISSSKSMWPLLRSVRRASLMVVQWSMTGLSRSSTSSTPSGNPYSLGRCTPSATATRYRPLLGIAQDHPEQIRRLRAAAKTLFLGAGALALTKPHSVVQSRQGVFARCCLARDLCVTAPRSYSYDVNLCGSPQEWWGFG
jgi:hypothetical protein